VQKVTDLHRHILAYAAGADGELEEVTAFAGLHQVVEEALREVARKAASQGAGYGWRGVGEALGMTKQSAWERFR
jgi:hypothetical protein